MAQVPWRARREVLTVASHAHFDHVGNHHEFSHRACHPAEAHILAEPRGDWNLADHFAVIEMFERLPPGATNNRAIASFRLPPRGWSTPAM